MFLEIEEIELDGFRGMQLNNIRTFKMRLDSPITVLLGRNGCGKSTLIRVMPPLCPNKKLFKVGGGRRLVVNSDRGRFELVNKRTASGWKNDVKNLDTGEDIIVGANPTVFDDIIAEYFAYTKELNQLLMGHVRLTKMNTAERKKWFSILSESDLTYALKFYGQARKRQRSLSGATDVIKEEIGDLKLKVLNSEEEFAAVNGRRDALARELQVIDNELLGVENNSEVNEDSLDRMVNEIEFLNRRIMELNPYIPNDLYMLDDSEIDSRIIAVKTKHDIYSTQLEENVKKLEELSKLDTIDVARIEERLQEATSECAKHREQVSLLNVLLDRPELENDLLGALQWHGTYAAKLADLFSNFSIAGFPYESEMSLNDLSMSWVKYNTEYTELVAKHNGLSNYIAMVTDRLEHIDSCQVVECDSCGNKFKPGIGKDDETALQEQLTKAKEVQKAQAEHMTKLSAIVNKYSDLLKTSEAIGDITRYFQNSEVLNALHDLLNAAKIYDGMGHMAQPWIDGWHEEVLALIRYNRAVQQVDKIKNDRAVILAAKGQDTTELAAKQAQLDEDIHQLSQELKHLRNTKERLIEVARVQSTLELLGDDLIVKHGHYTKALYTSTENIRFELLMSQRAEVSSVLNEVQTRMEEMVAQRKRLTDLEEQLERTITKHIHAGMIVKAMSPDEGALAKYLYKCINTITELMTAYINSMWGYQLKILPCEIKNGELDYQFAMWAGSEDNRIDDVSEGSLAQMEVIDYVFMLTVYKALKLERYPLWLDELGSAFDEGHSDEMINFIKGLLSKGQHSQVVMISHDASTHFQLTNADMVVLDPKGITLPSSYNTHVKIT